MSDSRTGFFEICIHRPVLTAMMSIALIVFGVLGLARLPVRELPDIDPSIVNVTTVYPGASAEVVETEVTERLEEAIASADAIKLMSSESREQASSITVEFVQGRDVDIAAQDVRDRVARVRGELPEDIDEPIISKQDASASPIMWIAFFSDRYTTEALTRYADDNIKDRLQTIPGVSSVVFGGEKKFAIRIRLDTARMAAREVTVGDIDQALREQNIDLPSGRIENLDRELTIQVRGQLNTPEQFDRLIIRQTGTTVVRLADVGRAEAGVEDERSIGRFNGKPATGLGIVRQSRANTVQVAREVKRVMAEIQPQMPAGMQWAIAYDSSIYIERAVLEVFQTLGIAFALVVVTIFLFLRDLRATVLPAMSVPVSILATFGALYVLGYSVNIFTLLALVLAIGIVVDDSIVVLENMHRHIEGGLSPMQAALRTMREIAFAIVTITLSLVAVFLPLAFLTGITGRLMLEFAAALVVAVVVSAFVALTLAPTLGARVLRARGADEHGRVYAAFERGFKGLSSGYARLLDWSLRHRLAVLAAVGISLWASWYCYSVLPEEFLPEEDKGSFLSMVLAPQGSTPEYTDRMMRKVERILLDTPEVAGTFSAVALPYNGPGDATLGFAFTRLHEGKRRHMRDVFQGPDGLGARYFREVEGAFAFPIMPKAVDVSFSQPFQLIVSTPDLRALAKYTDELIGRLRAAGFLANVRSTFELTKPEARVRVNRDRAGTLGVSIEEISRTLQVMFGGQDLSDLKIDGKQYEVIVQLARAERLTPTALEQVYVRGANDELVQLSNVVTLDTGAGPNRIERFQRQRSTTIEGTPIGIPLGTAVERAEAILADMHRPGFSHDWKSEARDLRESSRDIFFLLALAIVVVYMVLAAQFESLVHPFTVMLALPLAFFGAFGALYLLSWVDHFGNMFYAWVHWAPSHPPWAETVARFLPRLPSMNLNIFSEVGLVILVGLVTKNSILLVEFANQRRAEGMSAFDAMRQAGSIRLRPILMTSMATIAGIAPIAIGFGEAADSRRPLGVVAVGGMLTSTFLTLFVIPVFYTLFADVADRLRGRTRTTGAVVAQD